ncbi:hypothetical protein [Oligoflexus tunisiensis]|uniref:hypothetical protein n=1 Tax=Oligoflexus tunisiensis TaxID=708132 RepID=UPI00114C95E7|nr:hypothetical protein [Oligoflexus tunisiensis]
MFTGSYRFLLWTFAAFATTAPAATGFRVLYDSTKDHAKVGELEAAPISGWVSLTNKGEVAASTYAPNGGANMLLTFKDGRPEVSLKTENRINNFIFNEANEAVVWAEGALYLDAFGKSKPLSSPANGMASVHDFNTKHQVVFGKQDGYDFLLEEIRLTDVENPEASKLLVKTLDEDGLNESPFINVGHVRINNSGRIVFMGKEGTWADRQTPGWQNTADIYTVDAEGNWSQVKRTGSYNIIPYRPFWISDADHVVYEAEDSAGATHYYVTTMDGSGKTWQIGLQDNLSGVTVLDVSVSGRILFEARNAGGEIGFYVSQENGPAQLVLGTAEALSIHDKLFLVDLRYGCLAFGSLNDHDEVVLNLPLLNAGDKSPYGNVLIHLSL